jgi:hypothetical protein
MTTRNCVTSKHFSSSGVNIGGSAIVFHFIISTPAIATSNNATMKAFRLGHSQLLIMFIMTALSTLSQAFSGVQTESRKTPYKARTTLNAWALPNPLSTVVNSASGYSRPVRFKAAWYDDHHPTARKVVYHDE